VAERWFVDGLVDLVTFQLLEQIARNGSVTGAAAAMGISQQAASARLVRAERRLGHALVHRAISGSALTEHGGMVLEWATPVLEAARRAAVSLDALRDLEAPLTVAASQTIAEFLLPGWLQILRRADPGAAVRLVSGNSQDVVGRVRGGTAQLGFIESPNVPDGLETSAVAVDELVLVVAPDHAWAAVDAVSATELAAMPLLLREPGSGTRATLEEWLDHRGLSTAAPAAELGTTSAIRAAAIAGVAPAVLSERAVLDDLATGRLRQVVVMGGAPRRRLVAVWSAPQIGATARALVEIALRTADGPTSH
jgi:molybdate transport repressor ModE-like protein